MTDLSIFLEEHPYIDYSSPLIRAKAGELFSGIESPLERVKTAYEFVRDEIPHNFDTGSDVITAKASDVLARKTGICHSKANLLAALLRSVGIPAGFCYQHLTLADDDSLGYCVHCYNAVFVGGRWIFLDARGNTNGRRALFSPETPVLAFNQARVDGVLLEGIYAHRRWASCGCSTCGHDRTSSITLQDYLEGEPISHTGEGGGPSPQGVEFFSQITFILTIKGGPQRPPPSGRAFLCPTTTTSSSSACRVQGRAPWASSLQSPSGCGSSIPIS
jgi:transglutaminase-like putative cysteine protease